MLINNLNKSANQCRKWPFIWKLDDKYKDVKIYNTHGSINLNRKYNEDIIIYSDCVSKKNLNLLKYININSKYLLNSKTFINKYNKNYIAFHIRYSDKKTNLNNVLYIIWNILKKIMI